MFRRLLFPLVLYMIDTCNYCGVLLVTPPRLSGYRIFLVLSVLAFLLLGVLLRLQENYLSRGFLPVGPLLQSVLPRLALVFQPSAYPLDVPLSSGWGLAIACFRTKCYNAVQWCLAELVGIGNSIELIFLHRWLGRSG